MIREKLQELVLGDAVDVGDALQKLVQRDRFEDLDPGG